MLFNIEKDKTGNKLVFNTLELDQGIDNIAITASNSFTNKDNKYYVPYIYSAVKKLYDLTDNAILIGHMNHLKSQLDKAVWNKDITNIQALNNGNNNLMPFQKQDINFLKSLDKALIFNEMRTGKTITTLMTIKEKNINRAIVVCPKIAIQSWQTEIEKELWELGYKAIVPKSNRPKAYKEWQDSNKVIMVVSTDSFAKDVVNGVFKTKEKEDAIVIDECHYLIYPGTNRTKGMKLARKYFKYIYLLTGTPGLRHDSNITYYISFITGLSQYALLYRYFNVKEGFFGGFEIGAPKEEFKDEWLEFLQLYSVQRKQKEVYANFKDNLRNKRTVALNKEQKDNWNCLRKTGETCDGEIVCDNAITVFTRARQLALDGRLLNGKKQGEKSKWLIEYIKENKNMPLIIFSQFTSYLKLLKEDFTKANIKSEMIIGEISKDNRTRAINNFQNGKANVILINIKAGGVGITLDRAETTIFVDRSFLPSDNEQAEARMSLTAKNAGNENAKIKEVIDLVAEDSIDERVHKLINKRVSETEILNWFKTEFLKVFN